MFDWLQLEFMQRGLAAGLLVAAICPVIGLFLVLRRLSLIGDGLGHIAFAGVAAGFYTHIYPLVTALGFTVMGALGIEWLRSRQKAYGDLALAIFFYSGIAGGVILSKLSGSFSGAQLFGYLFGQISTVSATDVWLILGLGIVVVAIVALLYKELFALTFDEATARVSGIRVGALNVLLAVMAAVTVSVGMRIVGLLMVAALMIVPVAAALQLGRGFKATLFWSVLFSMVSLVTGLATSYYLDLPPGGTIVMLAVGLFLLTSIFRTAVAALARSAARRSV